jgi:hypothetical protein
MEVLPLRGFCAGSNGIDESASVRTFSSAHGYTGSLSRLLSDVTQLFTAEVRRLQQSAPHL